MRSGGTAPSRPGPRPGPAGCGLSLPSETCQDAKDGAEQGILGVRPLGDGGAEYRAASPARLAPQEKSPPADREGLSGPAALGDWGDWLPGCSSSVESKVVAGNPRLTSVPQRTRIIAKVRGQPDAPNGETILLLPRRRGVLCAKPDKTTE